MKRAFDFKLIFFGTTLLQNASPHVRVFKL